VPACHCESEALQFGGEREPNIEEGVSEQVRLETYPPVQAGRLFMKTLTHFKRQGDSSFHLDPQHVVFLLVAGFVLAALVVLVLVPSAR